MRYFITTLIFLFSVQIIFGQKKQVCFSFDDLPFVSYGITDSVYQQQLMDSLIASLNIHQIPAIGFVNEKKLFDKNGTPIHFQVGMLKSWGNSGHDLGTHTFSYPNYNKVSYAEYTDEIITPAYIITMAK